MHIITREEIRAIASSDAIFSRGMIYYSTHAVSNVTWNESSQKYKAIVTGSNKYVVTIAFNADNEITHECNCPSHIKYNGACKHVVAALLFISDYQNRKKMNDGQLPEEEKTVYRIIEYFRKKEFSVTPECYYRLSFSVNLPTLLNDNNNNAYVTFYAGDEKLYKINNMKKFIADFYEGKNIQLGKKFNYIPGECMFDPASMKVLDYINEIYEIQQSLGKTYYTNLISNHETIMSKKMLVKFLEAAVGLECSLLIQGKEIDNVNIVYGNPNVIFDIDINDNALIMKNNAKNKMIALSMDGSLLYYDGSLYLPEKKFIQNLLPFFNIFYSGKSGVVEFKDTNKNFFIERILPQVKKNMTINLPDKLNDIYVVESLKPQIHLDISTKNRKHYIVAHVSFIYGKHDVNPLADSTEMNGKILIRDRKEEERLTRLLYELNFSVNGDTFILKDENAIFALITGKINILTENFDVFYSKEYKNIGIRKLGHMTANVRINSDINVLEMEMGYSAIPSDELLEFFKAIRLKKHYFRLKDGGFIDIFNEKKQIKIIENLVNESMNITDNTLSFSKNHIMYVENILRTSTHVTKDESYEKLINDLSNPVSMNWELPKNINATLRPYQVIGYNWLKTLAYYNMGGILADDMGLGKTLQSILYICSNPGSKNLIVCPTSLAYNWQEEFEKFAPHISTCIVQGTPAERKELINKSIDVTITTYPLIRKDIKLYEAIVYDTMIIDEAQFIKNQSSLGSKAVKCVRAKHRFALTGTPVENSLSELWSVFEFIMPGFFPKYSKFSSIYEKPIIKDEDELKLKELKTKIQPFILRRMKKDVLEDLPDKIETRLMAEMTRKQNKIYNAYLSRIQSEIKEKDALLAGSDRLQILAALTRLRQICCHPSTFIENYEGGSGKMDLLMEKLPQILEGGHSVIIFSQFTSMLSIIAQVLDENEIKYFYMSGATKPVDRKQYVKDFNKGLVKVFLISLKAGGTGLNLTGADTVIHFDPWWNPAVEQQATDRAYRIGQKRKVQVIKFIMKDSIEEKIAELQKRKMQLSDTLIESNEVFVNKLDAEELKNLFF